MKKLLVDTGPLVAWFNRRDNHHALAAAFFGQYRGLLLSTWPVVTEVCHLVPPHVALRFMQWLGGGAMRLVDVPDERKRDIAALMERYVDQPMDVADATLVWLAEAASVYDIITVDQADFSAIERFPGSGCATGFFEVRGCGCIRWAELAHLMAAWRIEIGDPNFAALHRRRRPRPTALARAGTGLPCARSSASLSAAAKSAATASASGRIFGSA